GLARKYNPDGLDAAGLAVRARNWAARQQFLTIFGYLPGLCRCCKYRGQVSGEDPWMVWAVPQAEKGCRFVAPDGVNFREKIARQFFGSDDYVCRVDLHLRILAGR